MRGVHIFEKPCYREIRVMRGRAMRGLPVFRSMELTIESKGSRLNNTTLSRLA